MTTFQKDRKPLSGLPPYSVRVSARAKRIQLQVSIHGRVEVVIPPRFNPARIPAFVAEHRLWLERTLARLNTQRGQCPELHEPFPPQIDLPAIGRSWQVSYRDGGAAPALRRIDSGPGRLHLATVEEAVARQLLQQWLTDQARSQLVPWVRRLSDDLGLPCARVTVRAQKTRWGSCSTRKNININRNLLFLRPPVVRYLFVHELCHTVYLNHSRRYWALVAHHEPDYRRLDAELSRAGHYVPLWAYPP
ncbi:MAG TPA: SprT family zinc-dependent metalloprotease [Gammaproteobacteria bacterium]|nr:SprT family zinc-dependent metalloprotease [Gammaproteobacteria bacterium]